jgi:uncharacterized protein (TIGR03067 family)
MIVNKHCVSRLVWLHVLVLANMVAILVPCSADDAAEKESSALKGHWKVLSLNSDGQDAPKEVIETWRWVIQGGEITMSGDAGSARQRAFFKINPGASPKAIDITGLDSTRKAKSFPGIYRLDGRRLTICLPEGKQAEEGRGRPETFEARQGMSLLILERVE